MRFPLQSFAHLESHTLRNIHSQLACLSVYPDARNRERIDRADEQDHAGRRADTDETTSPALKSDMFIVENVEAIEVRDLRLHSISTADSIVADR